VKNVREGKFDAERLLTSSEVGELLQVNASSVKKWIEEGRIRAFRTPGGHRRVRVFDLVRFLEAHDMPVPRSLGSATKRRVLIVDDDIKQLEAFERILKTYSSQLEVSLTTNGIDALVLVGAFRPHLVVLDVFMPEIDGLEVCRRLRANPETASMEVIIASGQLTPELERKALEAGAHRCFHKPIDLKVVLREAGVLRVAP
jgi:excisionase family DNA binding protein